jgi:hypothetical protein
MKLVQRSEEHNKSKARYGGKIQFDFRRCKNGTISMGYANRLSNDEIIVSAMCISHLQQTI